MNQIISQLTDIYKLSIPRVPLSGMSGEIAGRNVGSSIEFQDFREYIPGDDLRHIDWAAYARTDTLMVRLYREEVFPCLEIIVDNSISMSNKKETVLTLVRFFMELAGKSSALPRLWKISKDRIQQIPEIGRGQACLSPTLESKIDFSEKVSLESIFTNSPPVFRRNAIRIFLSDFLFPHNPDIITRILSQSSAYLAVIQVLTQDEISPELSGGTKLCDIETRDVLDIVIDRETSELYKLRLKRLQIALEYSCKKVRAPFLFLTSDTPLEHICREKLYPAGVIEMK